MGKIRQRDDIYMGLSIGDKCTKVLEPLNIILAVTVVHMHSSQGLVGAL